MTKTVDTSAKSMYSVREVADFLSVSSQTVKKLIETGKLKAIQVSDKSTRVTKEDLADFLNTNRSKS